MVMAGDITYYGILQAVVELRYAEGMPVVLFMCQWYNTDPNVPAAQSMIVGFYPSTRIPVGTTTLHLFFPNGKPSILYR